MKFIIPTSPTSLQHARRQAQVIKHFGSVDSIDLVYFPTPSVLEETREIAGSLGASILPMEMEPKAGHPVGPNQQFAALVMALGQMRNESSFLWMEPDMLPRVPKWHSLLEREHKIKNVAFLGNLVPFGMRRADGTTDYRNGDVMMMGCGVYPPHMQADERISWAIQNLGKQPNAGQPRINGHMIGFDVYLRNPMKQFTYADTNLISDQWNTGNYRVAENLLFCDPLPFDRPHKPRGGVVHQDAVLIHGCKDDTLAAILLGEVRKPVTVPVAKPAPIVVPPPAPAPEIEDIEVDEDDDILDVPVPEKTIPVTLTPMVNTPVSVPTPAVPQVRTSSFVSANPKHTETILGLLAKKNYRAGDIAKKIGTRKKGDSLTELLNSLGFEVLKPSGWVKPMKQIEGDWA